MRETLHGERSTYTIHARLFDDGMAEHWLAIDALRPKVPLVLKRLLEKFRDDETMLELFQDEAHLTRSVSVPQVAHASDGGEDFFVLEYGPSTHFRALFDALQGARLPVADVCGAMGALAIALDGLQRASLQGLPLGILHRDLCLQNLLVGFDGSVLLSNFSVAKSALRKGETQSGVVKGRFGYMSPEQLVGIPLDWRSDLFSLSVCTWELLEGRRLFQAESDLATLEKVRKCDVPPMTAELPAGLESVVRRGLSREREARWHSAAELGAALAPFAAGASQSRFGLAVRRLLADEHARIDALLRAAGIGPSSLDDLIRGNPR